MDTTEIRQNGTILNGGSMTGSERGNSLSVLFSVSLVALLLVAGLVVDGGAQAVAKRVAEQSAAQAARAAADETAAARLAGKPVNVAQARQVALRVLRDNAVEGSVTVASGRVRVSTTSQVRTVFLALIGVNELRANGSAEANLVTDR